MTSSTIPKPATRRPAAQRGAVARTRPLDPQRVERTRASALARVFALVIAIGTACALAVALGTGAAALLISRAAP